MINKGVTENTLSSILDSVSIKLSSVGSKVACMCKLICVLFEDVCMIIDRVIGDIVRNCVQQC